MGGGQSVPCHDGGPEDDCSVITISDDVVNMLMRNKHSDDALDALEERWMESLKDMDRLHSCRNGLSEDEVLRMVQNVESRFAQLTNTNAACHAPMEKVFRCYRDHPKQSLMCAKEVKAFNLCVDHNTVEKVKEATSEQLCDKDKNDF